MSKRSQRNPKRQPATGRPASSRPSTRPGSPPAAGSKAAAAAPRVNADQKTFDGLRRFNLIMGGLHLVQSILMVVLSTAKTYPITTDFFRFDTATRSLVNTPSVWANLPFGPAVALFLFISAVAHFILGTVGNKRYNANLARGMNPVRFYEYALSSSWMIVLIGILVGITNLGALIAMFGVNAAMNLFGIMMEKQNQTTTKTDWTSFIYGCIAGIFPWIVILIWFLSAVGSSDAKPPSFVYAIVPTLFVFFNCFAINMYLQYKKIGKWKDYLYGERAYIILSLSAKTVLAWIIWSGTLAP